MVMELQVVQEKLEVETYGRAELEELQRKLLQERAELRARIDAETKNSTSLTQHKRNLEDERDAKLASMKSDMQGVDNKIEAEKAAMQEWASLAKEEEGEESVLQRKLDESIRVAPPARRLLAQYKLGRDGVGLDELVHIV